MILDVRTFWLASRDMAGAGALVPWLGLSLFDSRQAWPESRVDTAGCGVLSVTISPREFPLYYTHFRLEAAVD